MSPRNGLYDTLEKSLIRRNSKGSRRRLSIASKTSVDFSSNDFLSLSKSRTLRSEFLKQIQEADEIPLGSGGSRLLDGNSEFVEQLEKDIAEFHHAPAGLIFNSGFDANSALFSCIPQPGDVVVYDEFIHASVHEGMRLSRASICRAFTHSSISHLNSMIDLLLEEKPTLLSGKTNLIVAVETVYSMDGDVAPISQILDTLSTKLPRGNGHLIVDEAHSTGVYGDHGRGLICELGLEDRIIARLHTFGKALSSGGGSISHFTTITDLKLIDQLLQQSCYVLPF